MTVPTTAPTAGRPRPKLLYLVTEDWYFWSHRLPMARAARDAGFDVTVATRVDRHGERIAAEGFRVLPLSWRRRSVNPLGALAAVREIAALYRRERPDVVHHVAMKPVLLGGLAALAAGVPAVVNALAGLGTVFTHAGKLKPRLVALAVHPLLRRLLNRRNSVLLLQNPDDRRTLERHGLIDGAQVRIIRGSGIDTGHYQALPAPPAPPLVIGCAARLLANKGIAELVEAHGRLRARGLDVELLLAGQPDPASPTSIPQSLLDRWAALPGVTLLGQVEDVRKLWARCHVAVLASRGGEGLPKSLLEAAACGRAIVATDVPGCREVAQADVNALLVPESDPAALAEAIERLARDPGLRARFGEASRRLVESDMSAEHVGAKTVELYRGLLDRAAPSTVPAEASGAS
ncbi:glycosyltransferase involved in cell wall biosynthesis [Azospirillum agricola]|uniref:glycosyltransferase family 4 protein n=1 Tax=Azospirillum agricola TaxID=1720247 RepID=UPI001B3B5365|nr:glycosyltransferase family 4 protein [Azospirillum agricola]MBP2231385.1 glycosyltransferase involved in cell wall biosynthesis [Azospirillum agricola]